MKDNIFLLVDSNFWNKITPKTIILYIYGTYKNNHILFIAEVKNIFHYFIVLYINLKKLQLENN